MAPEIKKGSGEQSQLQLVDGPELAASRVPVTFSNDDSVMAVACGSQVLLVDVESCQVSCCVRLPQLRLDMPAGQTVVGVCAHPTLPERLLIATSHGRLLSVPFSLSQSSLDAAEPGLLLHARLSSKGSHRCHYMHSTGRTVYVLGASSNAARGWVTAVEFECDRRAIGPDSLGIVSRHNIDKLVPNVDASVIKDVAWRYAFSPALIVSIDNIQYDKKPGRTLTVNLLQANTVGHRKRYRLKRSDKTQFTCVSIHQQSHSLAVGNARGEIIIWDGSVVMRPGDSDRLGEPSVRLHWHSTPVGCIVWSAEGSSVHSTGGERVLVHSVLHSRGRNAHSFVPRLAGNPLTLGHTNTHNKLALTLDSNVVQLIESGGKLGGRVHLGPVSTHRQHRLLMADAHTDTQDSAVVTCAYEGQVQFCSNDKYMQPTLSCDLGNSNTTVVWTGSEHVTDYSVVLQLVVAEQWLCCVTAARAYEHDPQAHALTFWRRLPDNTFVMNSRVSRPHGDSVVSALCFVRPTAQLVSASADDGQCKVWQLASLNDLHAAASNAAADRSLSECWSLIHSFSHPDRPSGLRCLDVSHDGSVLAVAYGDQVVFYETVEWAVLARRTPFIADCARKRAIRYLCWSKYAGLSHMLYVANDLAGVLQLNTRSLCASQVIELRQVSHIASDPASSCVALAAHNAVSVWDGAKLTTHALPQSNALIERVCFVPDAETTQHSNMFLTTADNYIYLLPSPQRDSPPKRKIADTLSPLRTPFAQLRMSEAEAKGAIAKCAAPRDSATRLLNIKQQVKSLTGPAHGLPPLASVQNDFVRAFLLPKT